MSAPTEDQLDSQVVRVMQRVDPSWSQARVEQSLAGLHRRGRRRLLKRNTSLAGIAMAAAAAFAFFGLRSESQPEAPQIAAVVATSQLAPSLLTLSDGSTLRRFEGSEVVVQEVSATKVRVGLERGRVAVNVTPRPEREFVVDAGAFSTLVLGTSFEVDRSEGGVEVSVEHGHVRVLRKDGALMGDLYAGQSRLFAATSTALAPSLAGAAAAEVPTSQVVTPDKAPKESSDWRPHAREGGYDKAFSIIQSAGSGAVRDTVDDLLLAADAARLSGHSAAALPYLDKVLSRHSDDGRSSMAAFTRGRILLGMGQSSSAGASFEQALRLGASGSLKENALARAVEAYGRAGDGRAHALAERYVAQYPSGRWLARVKQHGGLK
jgi:transmembrane sensor